MKKLSLCIALVGVVLAASSTALADWDPNYKMHWPQLPDLTPAGMDVDVAVLSALADDFKCIETGPIADIHIWASFGYDIVVDLPFRLSIYADIPAGQVEPWSMPGELLWSEDFPVGDYTVRQVADNSPQDFFVPHSGTWADDDHVQVYQYNFYPDEPFIQEYCNTYWLGLELDLAMPGVEEWFGWKTTKADCPDLRWGDDAVYLDLDLGWLPLIYPVGPSESGTFHEYEGQTLDLAFVITPEPATLGLLLVGGLALLRRRRK